MNNEELLPCPFCGGKPRLFNREKIYETKVCNPISEYIIECSACQASSCYSLSEDIVIKSWNTRIKITNEEALKLSLKAYLQALDDTNTIIEEVMQKSINFYKQKINQLEKNI